MSGTPLTPGALAALITPREDGPDRLPPIPPEAWTTEQRKEAETLIAGPRGAVIAPFIPLLRSPELMGHVQRLGEYLRYRSAIGVKLTELAILITAREWQQPVEWRIHTPIALRAGLSPALIEALGHGEPPPPMDEDEAIVHAFCIELHREHRVSDATWACVLARFGEQGVVDMTAVNGYYTLLAMVMNVARTPG